MEQTGIEHVLESKTNYMNNETIETSKLFDHDTHIIPIGHCQNLIG